MPDTARVIFHPLNKSVTVHTNSTVLEAIREAGILFESICGGKGECNKCRVIFVRGSSTAGSPESVRGLSPEEIGRNYCRACQTRITGNCEFILPVESRIDNPKILLNHTPQLPPCTASALKYLLKPAGDLRYAHGPRSLRLEGYTGTRPHMTRQQHDCLVAAQGPVTLTITTANGYPELTRIEEGDTRDMNYGVAIDLGTTTVVGVLVNLTDGTICAEASALNRQITYGEELLTRMAYAKSPSGTAQLQAAAAESINEVISHLVSDAKISASCINDLCVAGNTVMSYFLLGKETRTLELPDSNIPRGPVVTRASSLDIQSAPGAYLFCLPNVSRFIGGDAVGDSVIAGMPDSQDLSLLIDLGTNGEVLLGNADWMASVSCASGPAFEGAGISSGMRGMRGAIDHVTINPDDCRISWTTIGNGAPRGICGSGIIDAAAEMADAGILDFTGKFVDGKPGVRFKNGEYEFVLVPNDKTQTGNEICIKIGRASCRERV
jgi:uncharacterized 2Fe-2S/4Fe-4S cluster protein (DUF4445 family)